MMISTIILAAAYWNSPGLFCDVTPARKIVVRFPVPDREMKRWMFAVDDGNPNTQYRVVIDDRDRFSIYRWNTRHLVIDIDRQLSTYYREGKRHVVHAFSRPGVYTLIFSDILETEPENMFSIDCRVRVPPGLSSGSGRAVPTARPSTGVHARHG